MITLTFKTLQALAKAFLKSSEWFVCKCKEKNLIVMAKILQRSQTTTGRMDFSFKLMKSQLILNLILAIV